MKKGTIFGIGIGILIIGIVVGMGAGSTPVGLPGLGGLPNSEDNQMSMSDSVEVTVIRGDNSENEESTEPEMKTKTIEVNLNDGAGSNDQN